MKATTRAKRISGVTAQAAALGCSREHLARCLRGERKMSRELRQRYEALAQINTELSAQPQPAK